MNDEKHCPTCGYLFDVPHNLLCAEVKGLREQVEELTHAVSVAWAALRRGAQ